MLRKVRESNRPCLQVAHDTGGPRIGAQFILDKATAMTNCQAVLAALVARDRGAGGQHIDVSMLNNGMAWGWPDDWYNSLWVDSDAPEAPLAETGPRHSTLPFTVDDS